MRRRAPRASAAAPPPETELPLASPARQLLLSAGVLLCFGVSSLTQEALTTRTYDGATFRYRNVLLLLQSAASAARLGRKQIEDPVPALSKDAGLKTLLPPYLHSLLHGDVEQRESAALGIAELVRLSSETTLKPVAIKVAGPLIRVGGDRFGGPVKAAVLEALSALLEVAPKLVKAFVPQLQATFAKALRDPALEVRRNGVTALGLLAPLSTRLDALVTERKSD